MAKSLQKWCVDNERMDILEQYGGVLGEYPQITEPTKLSYNSLQYIKWNCLKCGSYKVLTVKERTLIDEIECLKCKKQKALDKRFRMLQAETINVGFLAKTIHSSIPEQYIYYYLKKAFDSIESQKKFEWLGGMSIDLYIPEHKMAIEYDGERFHSNRLNDKLKFELCKKNGVKLVRVVEISDLNLEKKEYFSDWYYAYNPNYNYTNISEVIIELLRYIDINVASVFYENPINLKQDLIHIEKQIKNEFNKRTLFYKWPELAAYWDYKRNGDILPNHVFKSDNQIYYLKCPNCDNQYRFWPSKRKKSIPPCNCEKDRYATRVDEIINEYENTGIIAFEDTLLERQIEDEILQTAEGLYQCFRHFGTIEVYNLGSSRFSKPFLVDYFNKYIKKEMW